MKRTNLLVDDFVKIYGIDWMWKNIKVILSRKDVIKEYESNFDEKWKESKRLFVKCLGSDGRTFYRGRW